MKATTTDNRDKSMSQFKSDKFLILVIAFLILISVTLSFVSKHYESRVMGNAALGVAVLAPDPCSQEMAEKISLRVIADWCFNFSIIFSCTAAFLNLYVAFRNS